MNKDHSVFKEKLISFFSFNQHCGLLLSCAIVFIDLNWVSGERWGPGASCFYLFLLLMMKMKINRHEFDQFFFTTPLNFYWCRGIQKLKLSYMPNSLSVLRCKVYNNTQWLNKPKSNTLHLHPRLYSFTNHQHYDS